jgi:GR25 family glycosyltransferase involved in LPS biosynthesis
MESLRVFVINLIDKVERWNNFDNLNLGIERIDAVDTRKDGFGFAKFGLKLNPPDKITKLYFSRSKGAVGCYLSHYIFWKKVVDEDLEYALILEDDALVDDVENLLKSDNIHTHFDGVSKPKLIQFNKRTTPDKLPWWFDGTESYAINNKAARSLIKLTHDLSDLQGKFIEYAWSWPSLKCGAYGLFKRWKDYDKNSDFLTKDTIRYAADKFLGYCSLPEINPEYRLTIDIDPRIGLPADSEEKSDILSGKFVWDMGFDDLTKCETDESYVWWEDETR